MEKREARSVLIVFVILGVLIGQSTANFKECYELCFLECAITPGKKLYSCATSCLAKCIFPQGSNINTAAQQTRVNKSQDEAHSFCQLGCLISLCTNLSFVNKPAGAAVESCVNSCGKTCTRNYSP